MNHFSKFKECKGDVSLACLSILVALIVVGPTEGHAQTGPGNALQFNGIAAQGQVASNLSLTLSDHLTFEAWINPQKKGCNTILCRGSGFDATTDYNFLVGWNGSSC